MIVQNRPAAERAIDEKSGKAGSLVQRVSARAVLIAVIIGLLLCAVTPYNDQYIGSTYIAGNFFPIGALAAVLAIVLIVNPLITRLWGNHRRFTKGELVTIWSLIAIVSGLPSSGLMRYLIAHIAAPHYYSTSVNGWERTVIPQLPSYLILNDKQAVHSFFEGLRPGEAIPWHAWLVPLSVWSVFVACFIGCFFCLSALVRRQWVENERLSFPLVQVPILISKEPEPGQAFNSLMRSRSLWWAVAMVSVLHTMKGLHIFAPTVPDITTSWNTDAFFTVKPWNQLGIAMNIYPLVIGFAFLVPSEISFSLWFFYLAFKAQTVIGNLLAIDSNGTGLGACMGPAYVSYQEAGGALAVSTWLLWMMRGHLRDVLRSVFSSTAVVDDRNEPMSYRAAFWGLCISVAGMYTWLSAVAHISSALAAAVVFGALTIFILVSWLVAQGGVLFCQAGFSPAQLFTVLDGSTHLTAASLTTAAMVEHVGWADARELMMPSLVNAGKGVSETQVNARSFTKAAVVCVILSVVVSAVAFIELPYKNGGVAHMNTWTFVYSPQIPFSWSQALTQAPGGASRSAWSNVIGGFVGVLTMFICRSSFTWFGLHPAGFLVAGTYPIYTIWFSIFLGWAFKRPIMRYGGLALYRRMLPFVIGLILGDCINAIVWVGIGLITHVGYELLPG